MKPKNGNDSSYHHSSEVASFGGKGLVIVTKLRYCDSQNGDLSLEKSPWGAVPHRYHPGGIVKRETWSPRNSEIIQRSSTCSTEWGPSALAKLVPITTISIVYDTYKKRYLDGAP
jgi:hypothetical protein